MRLVSTQTVTTRQRKRHAPPHRGFRHPPRHHHCRWSLLRRDERTNGLGMKGEKRRGVSKGAFQGGDVGHQTEGPWLQPTFGS